MKPLAALALLVSVTAAPLVAQDPDTGWSRFRGPNGSGLASGAELPAEITGDNTLWAVETPGSGYSSPVLWGDHVYLTAHVEADGGGDARALLCYDKNSGDLLWRRDRPFARYHINAKLNGFASTSVTADAKHVYYVGGNGEQIDVVAFTHAGEVAWEKVLDGFDATDHGQIAPPVLSGGTLLVSADHIGSGARLAGLDPASGDIRWEVARQNAKDGYGAPVEHVQENGQRQAIWVTMSSGFTALDPANGKLIWEHNPGYKYRSVAGGTIANGIVFGSFGSGGGGKQSAALRPGTLDRPAEVLYTLEKGLPYVPAPVVIGKHMFLLLDGGMMSCLDQETGELVYDRERLSDGPSVKWFCSPVSDGKIILCCSHGGEIVAVAASPKFEVLGRSDLDGELINACPAVEGKRIYIRTAKRLLCAGE